MKVSTGRHRPVSAVDVAASAIARVLPRSLEPRIDQWRHDVTTVLSGLSGGRPRPYTDASHPAARPLPLSAIDPVEHALPRRMRRSWVTLRTDLRWLSRDLRGLGRPPVVARGASRYRSERASPLSPRPLIVREVVRETPEAVTLRLEEVDGSPLDFVAGQFLTFHLEVDGAKLRRAYSLSSSPLDGPGATITVKRIEGGRASTWMQSVVPGARLDVLGPSGDFVATEEDVELAMIAGGSGITPVISIAETALRTRDDVRVRLLYGNRSLDDVIFEARLDALRERFGDRLRVELCLESPPDGWEGPTGRLDAARVGAWVDALGDGDRLFFVCGPAPMMDAARGALLARGVTEEAIREERFQSADQTPSIAPLPEEPVAVALRVAGVEHDVRVEPGQTLLEAGVAAGVPMPFSCAMGGCAACKGRVVSGRVVMDEPNCLTPSERASGAVLTCCARPLGPARVEVE